MRKKDRTTNLQKEFTEQLEAVGKRLRSKWLYHIARELSINVVTSIALIVLFAVVQSEWVQEGSDAIKDLDNAIVLDPIKTPKSFLDIMVIGFFFLFLLYFVSSFFSNIIRLLAGPPKAGKTPEETIKNYFMNLVPTNLNRHNWVDAYVCLLDQCKESFGGYDTFILFWKEAKKALSDQIIQNFKPHKVWKTTWTLDECEVEKGLDGIRNYKVNFKVNAQKSIYCGINVPCAQNIGTVIVTAWVSLAQVGDRWYVAKSEWNPHLVAPKGINWRWQ